MNRTKAISFAGAALILAATLGLGIDWPMHGLDVGRSRVSTEPISPPLTPAWSASFGETIVASPVTGDGYVVTASTEWNLRALREDSGVLVWSKSMPGHLIATPAIEKGRVFVPCGDGNLYCLDLIDGSTLWTTFIGRNDYSSPALYGSVLYVGGTDPTNRVLAIDAATGAILWGTPTDQFVYGTPSVGGGVVYVGTTTGRAYALDAATGAVNWDFVTNGSFYLSGPLVSGTRVWMFPGHRDDTTFYGVDVNPLNWGSNTTATITDPAPPLALFVTGQNMVTSSPVAAGSVIVATVRFDYWLDTDLDFVNDTFIMNEYAIGIYAPTGVQVWQTPIGAKTTNNELDIPQMGSLPTPAGMSAGLYVAAASSIDANLRVLNPTNGAIVDTVPLDAPSRSSPAVSNARVVHATDGGTVWGLQGSVNAPPSAVAAGFDPAGGVQTLDDTPALTWAAAADATDGPATIRYVVRLDDDGEVLRDWDVEIQTGYGVGSAAITSPLAWNTLYTWAVRAQDDEGAFGPWSALQTFWVHQSPAAVTGLTAVPMDAAIWLQWTASAGPSVAYYRVYINGGGGTNVGNMTGTTVTGLTNGTSYTFGVTAVDVDGDESAMKSVISTPTNANPYVALNGVPQVSLAAALGAALPGSLIDLGKGYHLVPSGTTISYLTIRGANARDTILVASGAGPGIKVTGDADLERFTITGGQSGIEVTGGTVLLQNLIIRDHPDAGVRVSGLSNTTINLDTILKNVAYGVDAQAGSVTLTNSIVGENGIGLNAAAAVTHGYNDWYGNGAAIAGDVVGSTEMQVAVTYENPAANDYREVFGSQTVDAGRAGDPFQNEPKPNGDRVNMGAFGNTELATKSAVPAGATGPAGGGGKGKCGFLASIPQGGAFTGLLALALSILLLRRKA